MCAAMHAVRSAEFSARFTLRATHRLRTGGQPSCIETSHGMQTSHVVKCILFLSSSWSVTRAEMDHPPSTTVTLPTSAHVHAAVSNGYQAVASACYSLPPPKHDGRVSGLGLTCTARYQPACEILAKTYGAPDEANLTHLLFSNTKACCWDSSIISLCATSAVGMQR